MFLHAHNYGDTFKFDKLLFVMNFNGSRHLKAKNTNDRLYWCSLESYFDYFIVRTLMNTSNKRSYQQMPKQFAFIHTQTYQKDFDFILR